MPFERACHWSRRHWVVGRRVIAAGCLVRGWNALGIRDGGGRRTPEANPRSPIERSAARGKDFLGVRYTPERIVTSSTMAHRRHERKGQTVCEEGETMLRSRSARNFNVSEKQTVLRSRLPAVNKRNPIIGLGNSQKINYPNFISMASLRSVVFSDVIQW